MLHHDDTTTLPLLLHLNSEPWMNFDAYAAQSAEVPFPIRTPAEDFKRDASLGPIHAFHARLVGGGWQAVDDLY